jgi:hypothetical protein
LTGIFSPIIHPSCSPGLDPSQLLIVILLLCWHYLYAEFDSLQLPGPGLLVDGYLIAAGSRRQAPCLAAGEGLLPGQESWDLEIPGAGIIKGSIQWTHFADAGLTIQ